MRIATLFLRYTKGGLDKGFYLPKPFQSGSSPVTGHSMTCHMVSIYTFHMLVKKNDTIAKKYFEVWSVKQKKGRTGTDQKREKYSLFIAAFCQSMHDLVEALNRHRDRQDLGERRSTS
jgi:hypothetical protein